MPHVYRVGNYFAHKMEYPTVKFPVIDKGHTQEIEWPFRFGKSVVLRVPLTRRALVFGKWKDAKTEEAALMSALQARTIDYGEIHVAQEETHR